MAVEPATENHFTDVPNGADHAEAVAWCQARGWMNGNSDTTFDPEGALTRSMMATGLMRGYGDGTFGINDPVSREMLSVIMGRYQGEEPTWTGNRALAVPATRAKVAVALYENFNERIQADMGPTLTIGGGPWSWRITPRSRRWSRFYP